ncbi:MAG TPA: hypothetical protein VHP58_03930 [Alphaproteobacteria bacterium]|nr:hypothetical protein [Alphaproteobacteria bacterium]
MKKLMIFAFALVAMLLVGHVWAQTSTDMPSQTDGQIALSLSQQLYCQSKNVLASNLGLLIGVVMALAGLYRMVSGNLAGGMIMLICGALITALPSLVESAMKGTYEFTKMFRDNTPGEMCVPVCNGGMAAPGPGCQKT